MLSGAWGGGLPLRLIVLEGNNGVGKSTIASHLGEWMDAALFHFPDEFRRFRSEVGMDSRVPPMANLLYHLGATLHLSQLVREQLATRHVVCDRYLPGPLSLLTARGAFSDAELERLTATVEGELRRPDLTILVRADHAEVCARIQDRASRTAAPLRTAERWVIDSEEHFARREESLRHHSSRIGPLIEIDTTRLSPTDAGLAAEALCRAQLEQAG